MLREYVEIESDKVNERPQLVAAIDYAKGKASPLVIAKLNRPSRNAGFNFAVKDSG
jgi:hypothetical protein